MSQTKRVDCVDALYCFCFIRFRFVSFISFLEPLPDLKATDLQRTHGKYGDIESDVDCIQNLKKKQNKTNKYEKNGKAN